MKAQIEFHETKICRPAAIEQTVTILVHEHALSCSEDDGNDCTI